MIDTHSKNFINHPLQFPKSLSLGVTFGVVSPEATLESVCVYRACGAPIFSSLVRISLYSSCVDCIMAQTTSVLSLEMKRVATRSSRRINLEFESSVTGSASASRVCSGSRIANNEVPALIKPSSFSGAKLSSSSSTRVPYRDHGESKKPLPVGLPVEISPSVDPCSVFKYSRDRCGLRSLVFDVIDSLIAMKTERLSGRF